MADLSSDDVLERLVRNRLCGEVATPAGACVVNCRRLNAGDEDCTFGLSDWRDATFEEVVASLEALGGRRLRDGERDGPAFIEPAGTLAGLRAQNRVLAEFVAGGGGRVLLATGHPILVSHYAAVGRALARAGCELLQPAAPAVSYTDGVAAYFVEGAIQHTHRAAPMGALLASLGTVRPDLVVADHGFAGAAIEAGIRTLSIADINDPALPLAQIRGRTEGVLLIDDGLPPERFAPVTEAVLAW